MSPNKKIYYDINTSEYRYAMSMDNDGEILL